MKTAENIRHALHFDNVTHARRGAVTFYVSYCGGR